MKAFQQILNLVVEYNRTGNVTLRNQARNQLYDCKGVTREYVAAVLKARGMKA